MTADYSGQADLKVGLYTDGGQVDLKVGLYQGPGLHERRMAERVTRFAWVRTWRES